MSSVRARIEKLERSNQPVDNRPTSDTEAACRVSCILAKEPDTALGRRIGEIIAAARARVPVSATVTNSNNHEST